MSADANPQTIQIGARIADGKNAEITVGSQNYKSKRISLRSGVDMYYDITNYVSLSRGSAKIVITNTSGGIVSITNLKVTYNNTEQPINDVRFSVSPNLVSRALELTEMRLNGGDAEESFTVTFKDGAREEIQTVPSGEAAVAPNWTKEGYTLSWDKAFDHVTSNLIINAVWTAIDMPVKEYTVTFKEDGAVVRTEKVSQGKAATAPVLSKKGYVLSWDKAFTNVTSDLTVNAVWTAGKYTFEFQRKWRKSVRRS